MRATASLVPLRLSWPRGVSTDQVAAAMRLLASTSGTPTILEAVGRKGWVTHQVHLPEGRRSSVVSQLRTLIPGIGVETGDSSLPELMMAAEVRLNTRRRPLDVDRHEQVARGLLTALGGHGKDEALLLQLVLTDRLAPIAVPSKLDQLPGESLLKAALLAPLGPPQPADAETRKALHDKQSIPGWRTIGRIAVRAATIPRGRQLIGAVVDALRIAESSGVQIKIKSIPVRRIEELRGKGKLRLNVDEMAVVSSWPVGDTADLPVRRLGSRPLPVPKAIPRKVKRGRVIGASTWPGADRDLAITASDSLRHLHLLGPTGTGKSTLMQNLILQDIDAGRGVVVIDPKRDLIKDILRRIPDHRRDDVVIIDPTDTEAVVGINPLDGDRATADLRADQLLEVFKGLYHANWGVRTSDILGASLLTLARIPKMSLVAVPLLLTNPAFRRKVVGQVSDPVGLDGFWASYEAWSEAERTMAIAPVLNKLRPFLVRPTLRRIIGHPSPQFRFKEVFTDRRIVLVDLAKGQIGAEAASLLGALAIAQLWQAIQSRAAIDPERRHAVNVYMDEFQDYLSLPTSLADGLAQARGLGVGFTVAHQHLGQLGTDMREAVLANARSKVCFQLGRKDATTMGHTSAVLDPEDFTSLDVYNFYAQLVGNGQVQPWCSGRSAPPRQATANPLKIRETARLRWGTPVGEVDATIEGLLGGPRKADDSDDDLTPRRRKGAS